MSYLFFFFVGMILFSTTGLAVALSHSRTSRATMRRVREATRPASLDLQDSKRDRVGRYLADRIHKTRIRMGMSETSTLRDRITRAGYRGALAADVYIAARFLGPIVGLVCGSAISSNRGFWMIFFPAVLYLLPDIILQHMVRRRREKIRLSLPDAVDLLVICVEAGLGLDQALLRVGQELELSHPEITAELLQINREQRAGKPRIDAWQDMQKRIELPDLNAFVNMLTQTERFGTPIAKSLSNFADGLRLKRRQTAEEAAAKTTVKIIFPLVLFIFPSLFIVLLGPAAITISRGISNLSH
jgi:tight adherence protein C